MKKIFLTGASGFLGGHILRTSPKNTQILAQYRSHYIISSSGAVKEIQMDFTASPWQEVIDFEPDVIIHTAAMAKLDDCETNPSKARAVNDEATRQLVDIAREVDARFIYTSTDQIFDGYHGHYTESDPPNPLNVYGLTKYDPEPYILKTHDNAVVIRCALIYGMSLNGTITFTEKMISNLREGRPVNLFTDEFRSPILVNNLAEVIWELVGNDFHGVINVGGSQKVSRYEMGEIACALMGVPASLLNPVRSSEIEFAAYRPVDCSFNTSFASGILSTPLLDCHEGLSRALSVESVEVG